MGRRRTQTKKLGGAVCSYSPSEIHQAQSSRLFTGKRDCTCIVMSHIPLTLAVAHIHTYTATCTHTLTCNKTHSGLQVCKLQLTGSPFSPFSPETTCNRQSHGHTFSRRPDGLEVAEVGGVGGGRGVDQEISTPGSPNSSKQPAHRRGTDGGSHFTSFKFNHGVVRMKKGGKKEEKGNCWEWSN